MSRFSNYPAYKRAIGMGEALAQKGCSVAIAALDCPENRDRMTLEAPHCEVLWFRARLLYEAYDKLMAIWTWRPDVIYSTSYSLHNLAGLRLFLPWKMQCVIEFCELYSHYPSRRMNWWIWELCALVENRYVVCASRYLKNYFETLCPKLFLRRSICYLPYAYPQYLTPSVRMCRERKTIVFMASMGRGYGVFEVLDAFEKLVHRRQDVELEMIGGGPDKAEAERWVELHNLTHAIHVRGFVAEKRLGEYFSQASVFVAPLHDTIQDKARCPSKLFYYLPYGKPIVTCRLGNPVEILGDNGFYYCPLDTNDMADAFNRALEISDDFTYPNGFVEEHSWVARAAQFEEWIKHG